jgi:hypothetical protein
VIAEVGGGQRVDGLEAPLTGRDRDLRLLKELFHATEDSGQPRLLVLDGEPGVGKSRLAWEFEKYIDGLTASVWWHRGRCLSYGDGAAFWALSEAVRGRLGLVESDTGPVIGEHLEQWLSACVSDEGERDWLRPRVSALLGETSAATFTREDLFSAWTAFFDRVGCGDPVVLVIDDAQHADDALLDFVDHLLGTARFGIFVLAIARPEAARASSHPGAAGPRSCASNPCRRRHAAAHRRPRGRLPDDVRDQLVERADGIPLYAVETVRALIDRDASSPRAGATCPRVTLDLATVGAPRACRLWSPPASTPSPDERRVVADASVLGAVFTRDGAAALAGPDLDVDAVLESLRRKEILGLQTDRLARPRPAPVRPGCRPPGGVRHPVQARPQATAPRAAAHLQAVTDPGGDLAVVVAQHLLDALEASTSGDPDYADIRRRACAELDRAATRAKRLGALAEEYRLLATAIPLTDDPALRAALLERSATATADDSLNPESIELARESAEIWEGLGRPVEAGVSRGREALSLLACGQPEAAIELAEREWQRLVDVPDSQAALLSLSRPLANGYRVLGRHTEAHLPRAPHRAGGQHGDYCRSPTPLARGALQLPRATTRSPAIAEMAHTMRAPTTCPHPCRRFCSTWSSSTARAPEHRAHAFRRGCVGGAASRSARGRSIFCWRTAPTLWSAGSSRRCATVLEMQEPSGTQSIWPTARGCSSGGSPVTRWA